MLQAQFTYITNNGSITITKYTGSGGGVVIPSAINSLPVTSIGEGAFDDCTGLANVTIGDSVTSIGELAFSGCTGLTNVTIGDSVTSIGELAFSGCTSLTSFTIGNRVTSIGSDAFATLTSLANITIPSSVTRIASGAFSGCTSLTGVYFQGSAPNPSLDAFAGDHYVTVYYLPGATGWGATFADIPAVLWNPQVQPGSFAVRSNQFGFTITGSSNLVVVIQASTNLSNPAWLPLRTNTLNGNPLYFTDPQWNNYPSRFYRVSWP